MKKSSWILFLFSMKGLGGIILEFLFSMLHQFKSFLLVIFLPSFIFNKDSCYKNEMSENLTRCCTICLVSISSSRWESQDSIPTCAKPFYTNLLCRETWNKSNKICGRHVYMCTAVQFQHCPYKKGVHISISIPTQWVSQQESIA